MSPCAGAGSCLLQLNGHCRGPHLYGAPLLPLHPAGCVPSAVLLHGLPSTGKTTTVRHVLSQLSGPTAQVNCVECYMPNLLYQLVLQQLTGSEQKCDGFSSFVASLQELAKKHPCENIVIVFDSAERLREQDSGVLAGLLRLQELASVPVCCLFVTIIGWDTFNTTSGLQRPITIHFPQYSKADLLEVLSIDCPADTDLKFYRAYLGLLLSVFFIPCRNVSELRYLAKVNFARYREPVRRGEVEPGDVTKLWRNIQPQLRAALKSVYLREVSSCQWERIQRQLSEGDGTAGPEGTPDHQPQVSSDTVRLNTELPFYSKFLLLAAYLASYNPARSDRRFFVQRTAGRGASRLKRKPLTSDRTAALLTGPKQFPLDRMLAIFYSIVEDRVTPTASIYSQIASLVTLRMLARVGPQENLDTVKFKCLVDFDTVKSIAKTVDFRLEQYLYDLV